MKVRVTRIAEQMVMVFASDADVPNNEFAQANAQRRNVWLRLPEGMSPKDFKLGDEIEIPGGYHFVPMVDNQTGEVMKYKDGSPMLKISW